MSHNYDLHRNLTSQSVICINLQSYFEHTSHWCVTPCPKMSFEAKKSLYYAMDTLSTEYANTSNSV